MSVLGTSPQLIVLKPAIFTPVSLALEDYQLFINLRNMDCQLLIVC